MRLSAVNVIGSPMARASMTSQAASDKAPMRDSISSTRPHGIDRIAGPVPEPMLFLEPAVGDLLLDDVPQIEDVAARELPQPAAVVRVHRSAQGG